MKREQFLARLAEINSIRFQIHTEAESEGAGEISIEFCTQPCEWCKDRQTCQNLKRYTYDQPPGETARRWRWWCDTCKKIYDPVTRRLGYQTYITRGLRQASPGKRLGRPPAPPKPAWYTLGAPVLETEQEAMQRRADMLDRLEQLRRGSGTG